MEEAKTLLRLGQSVEYRDSEGRLKAAIVTATPESIDGRDNQSGVTAPAAGCAHLTVFSFTGGVYTRHDIPEGDGPRTFTVR